MDGPLAMGNEATKEPTQGAAEEIHPVMSQALHLPIFFMVTTTILTVEQHGLMELLMNCPLRSIFHASPPGGGIYHSRPQVQMSKGERALAVPATETLPGPAF